MVVEPNLWLTINLCKNNVFYLSMEYKTFIEASCIIDIGTYWGETFVELLALKVCKAILCR